MAKFTVEVQVTIEDHDDLADRALYHEVDHRGAYSAILLQCWAAGNSSGIVYLVEYSETSEGPLAYYWDADDTPNGLPTGHIVLGSWEWYFNPEAGDQVKIQTERGRELGL